MLEKWQYFFFISFIKPLSGLFTKIPQRYIIVLCMIIQKPMALKNRYKEKKNI